MKLKVRSSTFRAILTLDLVERCSHSLEVFYNNEEAFRNANTSDTIVFLKSFL